MIANICNTDKVYLCYSTFNIPMSTNLKHTFLAFYLLLPCFHGQSQTFENLNWNTDESLEICTWNIEWFPGSGSFTVNYVSDILEGMHMDLYAIQEIDDTTAFKNMVNQLEDYDYIMMDGWFGGLVYVYNTQTIEVLDAYEIFSSSQYWQPLPRSPLVLRFLFQGEEVYAINNHFKCCGDNYINWSNDNDEEMRRLMASTLIEEYMSEELEGKRVILLGDLNDMIDEIAETNVFTPFLNDPEKYRFADQEIALGSSSDWSYPTWPSHLDHIMITDEMFSDFASATTLVETIKVENEMGGWNQYEDYVSDHRPVAMRIALTPLSSEVEVDADSDKSLVGVYDVLGRNCEYAPFKSLLYFYSDGSVVRRISSSESQPE